MGEAPNNWSQVSIVPMRPRHLDGVVGIENVVSHRPWSKSLFASELKQKNSRCCVAVGEGSVVMGFGAMMWSSSESHITNIAVHDDFRRRSIATGLMLWLVEASQSFGAAEITLEVRASNVAAQRLYHRFGFAPEGVRPKYYKELNEDAIIMWAREIDSDAYAERIQKVRSAVEIRH